mmetsp:Transcript_19834/g.23799  ORF Transcript_19834/g.23799 Transcript_19834/m.23799 type:complete len:244 (+) Transcript_19834:172-903(+)
MALPPNRLILFGRLPVPGKCKTRLAAGIGPEAACKFYKACAEHIMRESMVCCQTLSPTAVRVKLYFANAADQEAVQDWVTGLDLPYPIDIEPQAQSEDLGARMLAAFENEAAHGGKKIVIFGTDIPDLDADVMEHAFAALNRAQVTLGPAADGGYYMIGMNKPQPGLFKDIPWSTHDVFEATKAAATSLRLVFASPDQHHLPLLEDIDNATDLKAWHSFTHPPPSSPMYKLVEVVTQILADVR